MPSVTMGAGVQVDAARPLPALSPLESILVRIRRRTGFRLGLTAAMAAAFAIGLLGASAVAPRTSEVDVLQRSLYAKEAQVAQLREQLALSQRQNSRLSLVQRYSAEYAISADLAAAIHDAAKSEGVRLGLAFQLVKIESGFRRTAVGPKGSIGYAQVKPSTAAWVDPTVTREMLFDTRTNLHIGFRYLSILLRQYGGDERLALLAYNRGPTRVGQLLALGRDPANGYARRVLARD